MKHGFSTLGCPELNLADTFALATRFQLDAIELRALGGMLDLPRYLAETYGTPAHFATVVAASKVDVVALDTSFKLVGSTAADYDALLAFVPWAEAAGVRWLRVFDGGKDASASEFAEAAARVAAWESLRREHGWRVNWMVETHDTLIHSAALGRFAAAVPACAILWDTHHTWKKGGEDPVATWRAISARVVHVHVKDSVSRPSARHPFTYVLPGDGEFPVAPLLGVLAREFAGVVSLEWERQWHPYLPPLENALRAAQARAWW